jgi:hypothetical protein
MTGLVRYEAAGQAATPGRVVPPLGAAGSRVLMGGAPCRAG